MAWNTSRGAAHTCSFSLQGTATPANPTGAHWGLCSVQRGKITKPKNCTSASLGRACKCPSNELVLWETLLLSRLSLFLIQKIFREALIVVSGILLYLSLGCFSLAKKLRRILSWDKEGKEQKNIWSWESYMQWPDCSKLHFPDAVIHWSNPGLVTMKFINRPVSVGNMPTTPMHHK